MEVSKALVLSLLLGFEDLCSADEWAKAFYTASEDYEDPESVHTAHDTVEITVSSSVVEVVRLVIPDLPEYKTFSLNLYGLLDFCQQRYPHEHFVVVRTWLTRTDTSHVFRVWLYEWIASAQGVKTLSIEPSGSKEAVVLATLREQDQRLKRRLLRYLDEKMAEVDGGVTEPQEMATQAEQLLVFYWNHWRELAPTSLLSAVKLVAALANQNQNATQQEKIFTLIKWGRALKPVLFEGMVKYTTTLKLFVDVPVHQLALSSVLTKQLRGIPSELLLATRSQLVQVANHLQDACQRKMKHVFSQSGGLMPLEDSASAIMSSEERCLVVAELAQDLDVVLPDVFADLLAVWVRVVGPLLARATNPEKEDDAVVMTLGSLFELLCWRADVASCFLVLSAIVEYGLVKHQAWHHHPLLYQKVVGLLSEAYTVQGDVTKRWILRMALQQLLFESDRRVLVHSISQIQSGLPTCLLSLTTQRLGVKPHCTGP
ncbi:hypothetical protein Poli38472_009599 [Pythium oligandrum]|uniref:Uncharacterized protein n=1 Tax=Pythium oligandrum TaxID=41045 RepID=A0A8K1CET5_PYTOL|nr:hypothetical protein Poli38472_009599 [Pythium oligandrum]|eukprot:TMW62106.1 hypothetical protein Poli38472_009599 [Pythium oligandrum]